MFGHRGYVHYLLVIGGATRRYGIRMTMTLLSRAADSGTADVRRRAETGINFTTSRSALAGTTAVYIIVEAAQ